MHLFPFSNTSSLTKEAVHTSPTIGSNVEQITVRKTHFLVWDIGGQESLRASWYSYYGNTEVWLTYTLRILSISKKLLKHSKFFIEVHWK